MTDMTFIHMDISAFPAVSMVTFPETLAQTEQWVNELDALLAREQAFALIYPPDDAEQKAETAEDMEARKYVRRWLKTGKEKMAAHCRGMILTVSTIRQDKPQLEKFAPMAAAIYGVPVFVAENLTAAQAKAADLYG